MRILTTSIVSTIIAFAFSGSAYACAFSTDFSYKGDQIIRLSGSKTYAYQTSRMAIDADGAPDAYNAANTGRDHYGNAGWPGTTWWDDILVPDPGDPSRPYEQTTGPYAGFWVSKTRLFDPTLPDTDYRKWVDSSRVPYLVFPGKFYASSGTGVYGDIGYAWNPKTGKGSAFIVADQGPFDHKLGEVSIALAEALGGVDVNPRNGAGMPGGDVVYVVFTYSRRDREAAWPISNASIDQIAKERLDAIGGIDAVLSCF